MAYCFPWRNLVKLNVSTYTGTVINVFKFIRRGDATGKMQLDLYGLETSSVPDLRFSMQRKCSAEERGVSVITATIGEVWRKAVLVLKYLNLTGFFFWLVCFAFNSIIPLFYSKCEKTYSSKHLKILTNKVDGRIDFVKRTWISSYYRFLELTLKCIHNS